MLKVIIVDDEPWIVSLIRGLIAWDRLGMQVVGEAGDAGSALELAGRVLPDVLITDIRMADMDGLDLVEATRRLVPEVRVIVISGHDDFAYARRALQLGAVDYLLKPVNAVDLTEALLRATAPLQSRPAGGGDDRAGGGVEVQSHHPRIRRALEYISRRYATELTLTEVAEAVDMGVTYFSELFKKELGVGFAEYLTRLRMAEAKRLLALGSLRVYEVAQQVGYRNANYFSRVFHKHTGHKATEYEREGGGGTAAPPPSPRSQSRRF
jgi:two-component system, response regulator YesN